MAGEDTLKDRIRIGTPDEARDALQGMAEHFLAVCAWIQNNVGRTDAAVALYNTLGTSAKFLELLSHNIGGHPSIIALVARTLYEINLRVRYIVVSDENMRQWLSEAVTDKKQVLEGILQFNTRPDLGEHRDVLLAEIERLESLRKKYSLPAVNQLPGTRSIARQVGVLQEHDALFKIFSKIVHPSSYLINDPANAASTEMVLIMQTRAQIYAWDTFHRVGDALSVPEAIREMPSGRNKDRK